MGELARPDPFKNWPKFYGLPFWKHFIWLNILSIQSYLLKVVLPKIYGIESCSRCYKTCWLEISIKILNKVCCDVWTCTKMFINSAIFNQKYSLKLFITFKMVYSCCFSLGEIWFSRFPPKESFLTSTTGLKQKDQDRQKSKIEK